jgi:small subunit ribosomal protein S6
MVRDYELMYIVRPDVDEDGLRVTVDSVKSLIEGQGGEVTKTTMWGKRRLAYEVKHLRDGHYVIVEMRLDGTKVAAVERALRIHDAVFRHLLVVQEAPSSDDEGLEMPNGDALGETPAPSAAVTAEHREAAAAAEAQAAGVETQDPSAQAQDEEDIPVVEDENAVPVAEDEE